MAEQPHGLWLTSRKDPANWARADVPAQMAAAPKEIWRYPIGGEVTFTASVRVQGEEMLLAQAGATLQLVRWDGTVVWNYARPGIGWVMRVDDFDGDGQPEALVTLDGRTLALFDVATGAMLWRWQAAPSTFISGYAFQTTPAGLRFYCFPSYSTDGYCFDFTGSRTPKLRWKQNYAGRYDAGFGPSIVLADMDGDGKAELVLQGKKPHVYQAILDADTGEVQSDVYYDAGGENGRPYGLLQAIDLDHDGKPEVVMAGCQVEEYLAVARNDGTALKMLWGQFVEKDWPADEKELRPQVTSLSDVQGNGKVELIIGLWENGAWKTAIIDPLQGFTARRGELAGMYFWGCYDLNGDGIPEIIVSREAKRLPSRRTTLQALDGRTLQPVAELANAAILTSGNSPLPADRFFMAQRNNPVPVTMPGGYTGILVRRFAGDTEDGLYCWGATAGQAIAAQLVGASGCVMAVPQADGLLLVHAVGYIERYDRDLQLQGRPVAVNGRFCRPLVWDEGGKRELVFDVHGGRVQGGRPDLDHQGQMSGSWSVRGTMPALHIDGAGISRLAVADLSDPDHPEAVICPIPPAEHLTLATIPLSHPAYLGLTPFGKEFRLLVNLQTGVHTMALACYDADGQLLWEDKHYGAHPLIPGAADLNGDGREEVIADDHGVLQVHAPDGTVTGKHPGWPPAYTLPICGPFGPNGTPAILRASGISGISLNDPQGNVLWEQRLPQDGLFRWSNCLAAVGDVDGKGAYAVGLLTDEGLFECFDVLTGHLRWSLPLGEGAKGTSIIAGDVDGDGGDEFLLGLPSGRLFCLGEEEGRGRIQWELQLDAAITNPILADVDGDGLGEIVLSTADGFVRILK